MRSKQDRSRRRLTLAGPATVLVLMGTQLWAASPAVANAPKEGDFACESSGSLQLVTTGEENFACGYQALHFDTEGTYNVASGSFALYSNTTGNENIGSGGLALYSNTTGRENIATGTQALYSNTSGSFNIATGLYFIVMAMVASSIGGYLAGRLRTRWRGVHTREVFFRDTAHGLLAWAFATLLSAGLLGSAASAAVGGGTAAVARVAGQSYGVLNGTVDTMLRRDPASTHDDGSMVAARNEVAQIFAGALQRSGDFTSPDRLYLAQVVAARTGISQSEAEQRVSAAIDQAKAAVDKARRAAAQLALWLTASLLVGAFSASLAAIEGGGLRDGTWKYQV